jgi:type IV pilus assembly protein PilV
MPGAVRLARTARTARTARSGAARGSSVLEVLVALVVLSVTIVGAAGLQIRAMKYGQVSQQRSLAVQQAMAISERMRSNLAAAAQASSPYQFDFPYADIPGALANLTAPACTTPCTAEQMATRHLLDWQGQLAAVLVGGRGTVTRAAAGAPYTVTVMWLEKELAQNPEQRSRRCPASAPADVQCATFMFQP